MDDTNKPSFPVNNNDSAPTPVPTWMPSSTPQPSPSPIAPSNSTWTPTSTPLNPQHSTNSAPEATAWSSPVTNHQSDQTNSNPLGAFVPPPVTPLPEHNPSLPSNPEPLAPAPPPPAAPAPQATPPTPQWFQTSQPAATATGPDSSYNPFGSNTPANPSFQNQPPSSAPVLPPPPQPSPPPPSSSAFEPPPTVPDFLHSTPANPQPSGPSGLDLSNLSGSAPSNTPVAAPEPMTPPNPTEPVESAPDDLSQVSQNPNPQVPVFTPPVTDGSNPVPQSPAGVPENLNSHHQGSGMKKWLIIGGIVVALLIAAGATYFLLMPKSNNTDTISLPATQAPLTNPPKQVKPSAVASDSATTSTPVATTSAQSAFDQLKTKKTPTKTASPTPTAAPTATP